MNDVILQIFQQNEKYFVCVFILALLTFAMVLIFGLLLADGHDKHAKRIEKLEEDLRNERLRSEYLEGFIRRYIDFGVYVKSDDEPNKRSKE